MNDLLPSVPFCGLIKFIATIQAVSDFNWFNSGKILVSQIQRRSNLMSNRKTSGETVIPTMCASHCGGSCLLNVHVKDGVITRIETDNSEEPQLRACLKFTNWTSYVRKDGLSHRMPERDFRICPLGHSSNSCCFRRPCLGPFGRWCYPPRPWRAHSKTCLKAGQTKTR